jgi:hypothetical protein
MGELVGAGTANLVRWLRVSIVDCTIVDMGSNGFDDGTKMGCRKLFVDG